jgi:hypothetical protein
VGVSLTPRAEAAPVAVACSALYITELSSGAAEPVKQVTLMLGIALHGDDGAAGAAQEVVMSKVLRFEMHDAGGQAEEPGQVFDRGEDFKRGVPEWARGLGALALLPVKLTTLQQAFPARVGPGDEGAAGR